MNKIYTLITLLLILTSCDKVSFHKDHSKESESNTKVESYYTCSMHPQIKESSPGKCPICHMNLTKVEVDNSDDDIVDTAKSSIKDLWQCQSYPDVTSEVKDICPIDGTEMVKVERPDLGGIAIAKVKLRKSQLSHFNPAFFPVTNMKMNKNIRLLGSVMQSEIKESNIPARIDGRVEKVYVASTGSFIKEGDPVLDLYSPKLISAGEEYIIARRSSETSKAKEFKEMYKQSIERLKLWGIKNSQFESWYLTKKVPRRITIYSPSTGIVTKRNAIVGKYFNEGQNFFEISDLSDVWVEIDVYEHDASLVSLGQKVKLEFSSLPGEVTEGEIDFIAPVLDSTSRTLKIRTTIKNPNGKLKPGMVADAKLEIDIEGKPLVVPRSAIIDTGKRKVVWIKVSKKQYQAKVIKTGYESEGYVEVKSGLMKGEEVVMDGNFLLDAQAQLFGGYEDFKSSGHNH